MIVRMRLSIAFFLSLLAAHVVRADILVATGTEIRLVSDNGATNSTFIASAVALNGTIDPPVLISDLIGSIRYRSAPGTAFTAPPVLGGYSTLGLAFDSVRGISEPIVDIGSLSVIRIGGLNPLNSFLGLFTLPRIDAVVSGFAIATIPPVTPST